MRTGEKRDEFTRCLKEYDVKNRGKPGNFESGQEKSTRKGRLIKRGGTDFDPRAAQQNERVRLGGSHVNGKPARGNSTKRKETGANGEKERRRVRTKY